MPPTVLVFPRKTQGLQGDPQQFGMPPIFPCVSLEDALNGIYDYDAHVALYHVEGEDRLPRINKSGYSYLKDNKLSVKIKFVFVDVDNENHEAWPDTESIEREYERVKNTEIGKNAGFYASRRGYRLFWSLPESIDAIYYESYATQLLDRLLQEGIVADTACTDWTRLFRLPFATPEGATSPLSLPYDFEYGDLLWKPAVLTEGRISRAVAGIGNDWSVTPPPVVPPAPEDYEMLKSEKDIYNRIKRGMPLADPGNRNNTMTRIVGIMANRLKDPTPEAIYRALAYSVAVDNNETQQNGPPPSMSALWELCKKFCAAVLAEKQEREQLTKKIEALARVRSSEVIGREHDEDAESEGVAEEDSDDLAEELHERTSIPIARRCVLFAASKSYYVLNQRNALYEGPFEATSVPAMIEKYCPRLAPPIRSGDKNTLISMPELLSRCGTEIKDINAVIGKKGKRFILETLTLEEGVAAIRSDLKPVYHAAIDKWLRLVGGANAEKLLDWLATFIELDKPTCGLYLKSDGGTGKGMLADGLARLWGTAPTMYQNIIGTHNDGLAICPLIWADEEIPSSFYGKTPSAVFRTIVGNSVFNLRRMYAPSATLHGCLRLLVTANNNNALKIHEDLTPEDYQAIVDRIGYIQVGMEAKRYLEDIGGRKTTEAWVAGDGIAEHVLWLAKNRKVTRGTRFLVKGWESVMHKHLQVTSGIAGDAVEVIAYALCQTPLGKGFAMGNNLIYATVPAVTNMWRTALGESAKQPTKQRVTAALQQLAAHPDCVRVMEDDGYHKYAVPMWALRPNEILSAIDRYQLGDAESVGHQIKTAIVPTA